MGVLLKTRLVMVGVRLLSQQLREKDNETQLRGGTMMRTRKESLPIVWWFCLVKSPPISDPYFHEICKASTTPLQVEGFPCGVER